MAKTTEIKSFLKKIYPDKTIKVEKGRGTASGWVHITLVTHEWGLPESDIRRDIDRLLESKSKEFDISYYTSDDGYDSENSCILINFDRTEPTNKKFKN